MESELRARKEEGAAAVETRLISFPLSFTGEGESSMINTHPELLPAGVLVMSSSLSKFCLLSRLALLGFKVLVFSGEGDRKEEDLELDAVGGAP